MKQLQIQRELLTAPRPINRYSQSSSSTSIELHTLSKDKSTALRGQYNRGQLRQSERQRLKVKILNQDLLNKNKTVFLLYSEQSSLKSVVAQLQLIYLARLEIQSSQITVFQSDRLTDTAFFALSLQLFIKKNILKLFAGLLCCIGISKAETQRVENSLKQANSKHYKLFWIGEKGSTSMKSLIRQLGKNQSCQVEAAVLFYWLSLDTQTHSLIEIQTSMLMTSIFKNIVFEYQKLYKQIRQLSYFKFMLASRQLKVVLLKTARKVVEPLPNHNLMLLDLQNQLYFKSKSMQRQVYQNHLEKLKQAFQLQNKSSQTELMLDEDRPVVFDFSKLKFNLSKFELVSQAEEQVGLNSLTDLQTRILHSMKQRQIKSLIQERAKINNHNGKKIKQIIAIAEGRLASLESQIQRSDRQNDLMKQSNKQLRAGIEMNREGIKEMQFLQQKRRFLKLHQDRDNLQKQPITEEDKSCIRVFCCL